jgi:ParB family chromosome partitioning protein
MLTDEVGRALFEESGVTGKEARMLIKKPVGWFQPDPHNPRKAPDENDPRRAQWEKDLDHLGDDMLARGVLVPLLARPDGVLVDGWRRWLAAKRKGISELPVIITDRPEEEIAGIRLATVFHKADLTAFEKAMACAEILESHPDWQLKDLAAFLHLDPSMITRLLSPSRCIPAAQEALKEGKIALSTCYALSKCETPEEQGRMLAVALNGASRDAIEKAGRKSRNTKAAGVRVARIKCPMSQAVVQISGEGISLDEAIEAAQEWVREAKKASEQGLDAKTFERVCRDKAKRR